VLGSVRDRDRRGAGARLRRRRRLPRIDRHWYHPLGDPLVWLSVGWTAALITVLLARLATVR
jgi:hypothetical protein